MHSFSLVFLFLVCLSKVSFGESDIVITYRQDLQRVGTHFDISFLIPNHPMLTHATSVTTSLNGTIFKFYNGSYEEKSVTCGATTCTFFIPGAVSAGTYDLFFYSDGYQYEEQVVISAPIAPWWLNKQIVSSSKDFFTGDSSIVFRILNVPSAVTQINLGFYTDIDGMGFLQGSDEASDPSACVSEGNGNFLCSYNNIGALCTDGIGFPTCNGIDYNIWIGFNPHVTVGYSINAYHHQPSRWEEGRYFANLNYNAEWNYSQSLFDLNVFQYDIPEYCYDYDYPYCEEVAYYTQWTTLFLNNIEQVMKTSGEFSINQMGVNAEVKTTIPRLPVGIRGYEAVVAYYPVNNPSNVTEVPLSCTETTCAVTTLSGVSVADNDFELRIYNRHPLFTWDDGNMIHSFGEEIVKTLKWTRVLSRQVFYNRSASTVFGNGTGNPVNSIDSSRKALLPGQSTTEFNYTNYNKGLNGIVIDVTNNVGAVSASDFQFQAWDGFGSAGFLNISAVATITKIDLGNGINRIKIEFADNAVRNTWLKVKMLANANTKLIKDDIFYFGHATADMYAGNIGTPVIVRVNATDTSRVRQNQSTTPNSVGITNLFDVNKDGRVNATDTSIVRQNQSSQVIRFFTAP